MAAVTNPLDDYLNDVIPVIAEDYKTLQRTALGEMIKLSADAVLPALSYNESRLRKAAASAQSKHDHEKKQIDDLHRNRYEEADVRNKQEIDEINKRLKAARKELENDTIQKRDQIINKAEALERQAHKDCQYEIMVAENVEDGTLAKIHEERQKIKVAIPQNEHQLAVLHEHIDFILKLYRRSMMSWQMQDPVPDLSMDDPKAVFDDCKASIEEKIETLQNLKIPRFFIGTQPYILCFFLVAASMILVWWLCYSNISVLPRFSLCAPAAFLIILAAMVFTGQMLWKKGGSQVRAVCDPIQRDMVIARAALKTRLSRILDQLNQQSRQVTEKRSHEVQNSRDQYTRMKTELIEKQQDSLNQLESQYRQLLQKLEDECSRQRSDAEKKNQAVRLELQQEYDRQLERICQIYQNIVQSHQQLYESDYKKLLTRWQAGSRCINMLLKRTGNLEDALTLDWNDASWRQWAPADRFSLLVRLGEFHIEGSKIAPCVYEKTELQFGSDPTVRVPAVLSFSTGVSLLLETRRQGRKQAIDVLRSVMLRLMASQPPGRVRFTILDPVGLGENFAGFMHAGDYDDALVGRRIWTDSDHILDQLVELTEFMETVIQKHLRNEFETIEEYNSQAGELAEPYRFLVIADFPSRFNEESARRLKSIINSGPRCGVFTLIAYDAGQDLPPGIVPADLTSNSVHLVYENDRFIWRDEIFGQFQYQQDTPPDESLLTKMMHAVGRAAKDSNRVEVPFEIIAPSENQFWSLDSSEELNVPIGRTGATRLQPLRLGRGVAQHMLIAGKTGSGKSTLLHVLITNLALWYSPDEVEMYLVDFKKGVEFKIYVTCQLAHARTIAIESDREYGLSVLRRIDDEMNRRGELFRQAHVQDITAYRKATGQKLPRTVLIVDEFQVFFADDDKLAQDAAVLLEQLVRQGRAFGIHVILGSQTLAGASSLARSTLGQMAVRIALQCSEADSQLILDDDNVAARLLSRPGEAIYNDSGGMVAGNNPFQTAWLSDQQREIYLGRINKRIAAGAVKRPPPIVFEGNVPVEITANAILTSDINRHDWSDAHESPCAWLGEPVAIKEPTGVRFSRQGGNNLLIIGQQAEAALGILGAAWISLAARHRPDTARFIIFNGASVDSPHVDHLSKIAAAIPHEHQLVNWRQTPDVIGQINEEVKRRLDDDIRQAPTIYLLIYGLQRYRMLRRSEDEFGFSMAEQETPKPDRQFIEILKEGPAVGIHSLIWADSLATVERTVDRYTLREFDNRVLFQMSAADSSNLIDSPQANRLGRHRAIYYSDELGIMEKFRPYALVTGPWLNHLAELMNKKNHE